MFMLRQLCQFYDWQDGMNCVARWLILRTLHAHAQTLQQWSRVQMITRDLSFMSPFISSSFGSNLSNVFSWFYFVVQDITKFLVHFRNATDQLILNLLQKGKTWWYKSEFYFLWNSQHLSKLSHFKLNSGWSHTNTVKCFRLSNFKYHFVSCSLDLNYFSSAQYLFTIRKL